MAGPERVLYRERTGWAVWVDFIYWGVMAAVIMPVLLGGAGGATARGIVAVGLLCLFVLIHAVVGGLTVEVLRSGVRLGLGNGSLIRRWIGFSEIEGMEAVTYRPLLEFGGWGVRGWGRKKAWTARGNQAVVLHLREGRKLYVGSDNARRLEKRIRASWEAYRRTTGSCSDR